MPTAAYHTLGCKVNQYETEKVREGLQRAGFRTVGFGSRADVYVVNTCTVTAVADSKSRAAIRRAVRANGEALIVVTGCLAEIEPDSIRGIDGVDLIVANERKDAIPQLVVDFLGSVPDTQHPTLSTQHIARPRLRTRAIVKVQDGCDHFCAYCVVPYARPGKRSRPLADVLAELCALAEFGYREVVLTGIRLGSYDDGGARLPDLIRAAADIGDIRRIRLSSVEPWEVDDALIDALAHPKVCRHLHVPLQSGDDGVLVRMGRPYDADAYARIAERLRDAVPGIGLTTDVIAGFPGETEEAFENTCAFVERIGFSRLHVFRYSPRSRTRAAAMPDQIDAATKKRRAEKLIEIGKLAMRRFAESFVGQTLDVLVERKLSSTGYLTGYTDNYIEVSFPGDASLVGEIAPVTIKCAAEDGAAVGECQIRNLHSAIHNPREGSVV